MSLKDRITDDMKAAMRAKDTDRLGTIRLLTAAMKQKEVDERVTLHDTMVVQIVDKLIKQRRDSVDAFTKAGRMDLADKESAEIAVLETYLPARLDAAAIATAVRAMVADLAAEWGRPATAGDMGKVMAAAKAKFAGQADMAQVSQAVKAALAG